MKQLLPILVSLALAPAALADGLKPGSVLVYPAQYSSGQTVWSSTSFAVGGFAIICVTNTNLNPSTPTSLGGATNVHFEYVNTTEVDGETDHCQLIDRVEYLTPADTLCVVADCHNATQRDGGYLVVSAQDPNQFDVDWAFDHLVGSEVVIDPFGAIWTIDAIPFKSPCEESTSTDMDLDGQLDFDGVEYEGIPDELYIDSFVAVLDASLILINLTGGPKHRAVVAFDIFNDNEFPLSATTSFQCWMQRCLSLDQWTVMDAVTNVNCISPVFGQTFLASNTPNDPSELDLNCDGTNDLETGWARIRGLTSSSPAESLQDPALLGVIVGGPWGGGGRRLWESEAKQLNGDFLNTGVVAVD